MSDVRLISDLSTGFPISIEIVNGSVTLDSGLEAAVVLSLFGGNFEDDGSASRVNLQYWGNFLETEESFKLRSQTQFILGTLPATPGNLRLLDAAVRRDLAWLTDTNVASTVEVFVRIPGVNRVDIDVRVLAEGEEVRFTFTGNWKASV